jgi:biuret amidohydrolase
VQNCFVSECPLAAVDGPATVDRINMLSRACRDAGMLVVHTRSVVRADFANLQPGVSEAAGSMVVDGASSAEFFPGLEVEPTDIRVDKPRYDAFYASDLEMVLRRRNVDTVIITGFATNVCCESTARSASSRDFRVLFVQDATSTCDMGGMSAHDLHRATCTTLGAVIGTVVTSSDLVGAIKQAAV